MKVDKGEHISEEHKTEVTDAYDIVFPKGSSVVMEHYYDRYPPGLSISRWTKVTHDKCMYYLNERVETYVFTDLVTSTHYELKQVAPMND